jgi:hypothetical protein
MRYASAKMARTIERTIATVLLIVKKNIIRPAKKRNKGIWRSVGGISTALIMPYLWAPRVKNERTRACSLAELGISGSRRYLPAHCWVMVADRADMTLGTKLSSHNALTRTMTTPGSCAIITTNINLLNAGTKLQTISIFDSHIRSLITYFD